MSVGEGAKGLLGSRRGGVGAQTSRLLPDTSAKGLLWGGGARPLPSHAPSRLSTPPELQLRNPWPRPGGAGSDGERAERKGARQGWVRARQVPAGVLALQETWKPKIKVGRVRCPRARAWRPGRAPSRRCLGSDPAGAAEARRGRAQSRSLGLALPAPGSAAVLAFAAPSEAGPRRAPPAQGAAGTQGEGVRLGPQPPAPRRGQCSFLEAASAAPGEGGGGGRPAASARRGWGPRSAGRLAASHREGAGRPKVRSGLSARPVRASGKEDENGTSQVVCVLGGGG